MIILIQRQNKEYEWENNSLAEHNGPIFIHLDTNQ